jgi:hypothetical protein
MHEMNAFSVEKPPGSGKAAIDIVFVKFCDSPEKTIYPHRPERSKMNNWEKEECLCRGF